MSDTTELSPPELLKLLLVEVTVDRTERPRYQHLATYLTEGFLAVAGADGWLIDLVGAEELGVEKLIERAEDADAVVLLGGEDVHPKFANQPENYPGGGGKHYELADEAQIALVRRNLTEDVPTFGICRGSQLINIALGGDLVQHIESDEHRNMNILSDMTLVTHDVAVDTDTDLGERLSPLGDKISVQSSHHQSVDRLGAGLRLVAVADDGIIEAFEHESAPIFAVQWHPEDPKTDTAQLRVLLAKLRSEVLARR
ncbi:MAG: gamma-glutamyl-gamma-aminobutyrate hydrolase family protein [Microbacteriaceae bacterium]